MRMAARDFLFQPQRSITAHCPGLEGVQSEIGNFELGAMNLCIFSGTLEQSGVGLVQLFVQIQGSERPENFSPNTVGPTGVPGDSIAQNPFPRF